MVDQLCACVRVRVRVRVRVHVRDRVRVLVCVRVHVHVCVCLCLCLTVHLTSVGFFFQKWEFSYSLQRVSFIAGKLKEVNEQNQTCQRCVATPRPLLLAAAQGNL